MPCGKSVAIEVTTGREFAQCRTFEEPCDSLQSSGTRFGRGSSTKRGHTGRDLMVTCFVPHIQTQKTAGLEAWGQKPCIRAPSNVGKMPNATTAAAIATSTASTTG